MSVSPWSSLRPEKLEIGHLMRLDQVTNLLPASLFSYNLYNSSQEGKITLILLVMPRYTPELQSL